MVLNERDILGAQLIKRNQELKVLYEKIKIAQSNSTKGEISFKTKEAEFAELKEKLVELRKEKDKASEEILCIPDFKKEVNSLQRELLKEKTKVRALTDELEYPMNVHRWQKMEATDPENYTRIMKIQTLQRRLITKTEEVEDKEKLIKKKEKLFMELKNILARQPGPEVYEQIQIYQSSLKDKSSQLKKMLAELKDAQSKASAHQYEINRIYKEIEEHKGKYFGKRNKEEKQKLAMI